MKFINRNIQFFLAAFMIAVEILAYIKSIQLNHIKAIIVPNIMMILGSLLGPLGILIFGSFGIVIIYLFL